ncbi:MAG TPA: alkaline phosphatase D family protein [Alphaproteobacteria bacterium]|jgi:alkaline phosphatase D
MTAAPVPPVATERAIRAIVGAGHPAHELDLAMTPPPAPSDALTRRRLLGAAAAILASAGLGPLGCAAAPGGRFRDDPFTLGVASGDPWSDGVVLWTRLAPDPLAGGGMPAVPVPVRWEVAEDAAMRRLAAAGETVARPEDAHAVHVEVGGLRPGRPYHYRFTAGGAASEIARTRTAPAAEAPVATLRFASCGCQSYESGFYTALRRLAEEELDFVVHTGDYIYEGARRPGRRRLAVRPHPDHDCVTLEQYRLRYALYKADPDLRAAHAAHPFLCVFDDHEVANDWGGDGAPGGARGAAFLARRAAAFRAYWEHMPLRRAQRPAGAALRLYRRLAFGRLVSLNLCDTRQYRTPPPCAGKIAERCAADSDPRARMLGRDQSRWLADGLARSHARWNVIAQQVPMMAFDRGTGSGPARHNMDAWDGYRAARGRLLRFLAAAEIANPVVLAGDLHRAAAAALAGGAPDPAAPALATEFVNTSISSGGDGRAITRTTRNWLARNPHVGFIGGLRGYCRFTVTSDAWQTDFRVLDRVTVAGAPARTGASFAVEAGRPGAVGA